MQRPVGANLKQYLSVENAHVLREALETCRGLTKRLGIHSVNAMKAAGFKYTRAGDTARCDQCDLEVSGWTTDMIPFKIHSERRPDCAFVRSVKISPSSLSSKVNHGIQSFMLIEVEVLKQVRYRTFSHWPHQISPLRAQMIEAGFFNCNVGDRVICLYCNLICQQWTSHTDDPCEVHETLSPQCPFVLSMLVRRNATSVFIAYQNSVSNLSPVAATSDQSRCNSAYTGILKRQASFTTWFNP